jgi:hypothetical protein
VGIFIGYLWASRRREEPEEGEWEQEEEGE